MESKCPLCGAKEIPVESPRTYYECGSSDYDQQDGTFVQSEQCEVATPPQEVEAETFLQEFMNKKEQGILSDHDVEIATRKYAKLYHASRLKSYQGKVPTKDQIREAIEEGNYSYGKLRDTINVEKSADAVLELVAPYIAKLEESVEYMRREVKIHEEVTADYKASYTRENQIVIDLRSELKAAKEALQEARDSIENKRETSISPDSIAAYNYAYGVIDALLTPKKD